MDAAEAIVAEIDITPFRAPGNANDTGTFSLSSGIWPRYPVPYQHSYSPSHHPVLASFDGTTTSIPSVWGSAVTLKNIEPQPLWNLTTTSWSPSVGETGNNITHEDSGPGWWSWEVPQFEGKQWDQGLMAATGLAFYTLALCTAVGNALVIYAIRNEKSLQTVSDMLFSVVSFGSIIVSG